MDTQTILRQNCIFFAVFFSALAPVWGDVPTLSPYFVVEDGDPSLDKFPLKRTAVEANISGVIASIHVRQTYANQGTRPINAKYTFPASTRASVHGMTMTIGEHVISARIRERQKARQEFETAKKAGKSASLLEQQRPNVFTMDVGNVLPGDVVEIDLHYTELIVPEDGVYEFVYPAVVGPRYSEIPEAGAPDHDRWVKSPYLEEGETPPTEFSVAVEVSTGVPLQELACTSHEVTVQWPDRSTAVVAMPESAGFGGDRDFILQYRLNGEQIQSGLMLYEGADENFFLLMAQPPKRVRLEEIPPREYIFVVDVSGSMNGFPLDVSKTLLKSLIGALRPVDKFNMVLFAGGAHTMAPESVEANAQNIEDAIALIDQQKGGGGTRLLEAMQKSLAMPRSDAASRSLIVVTDGYIAAEKDVFIHIRENLNRANIFAFGIGSSVNRYLIEGVARAGMGEVFVVTEPDEGPAAAERFREYVQSPLLTGVSIAFDGFDAYDVEPRAIPDLTAQRPLIIFGKWRGAAGGTITLRGVTGHGPYTQTFDAAQTPPDPRLRALRYLWARSKVAALSDYNFNREAEEAAREVTTLGLTYDLLTQYTSFVAVHDVIRNLEQTSQDVTQPLPLPEGVSNLAVGAPPDRSAPFAKVAYNATRLPEPELMLLLVLCALAGGAFAIRRMRTSRSLSR